MILPASIVCSICDTTSNQIVPEPSTDLDEQIARPKSSKRLLGARPRRIMHHADYAAICGALLVECMRRTEGNRTHVQYAIKFQTTSTNVSSLQHSSETCDILITVFQWQNRVYWYCSHHRSVRIPLWQSTAQDHIFWIILVHYICNLYIYITL